MKRILVAAMLAATAVLALSAFDHAGQRASKTHHATAVRQSAAGACSVSDPSLCAHGCSGASGVKSAAKVAGMDHATASIGACPVADPSTCPASCRSQAGAVAAAVSSKR